MVLEFCLGFRVCQWHPSSFLSHDLVFFFLLHFNCCILFLTFASGSLCFLSSSFFKVLQGGCHGFLIQLSYYVLFFPQAIVFVIHRLLFEASTNQGFSLSNFYSLMTFSFSLLHINRCSSLLSFSNLS
jgi:hypothetical protein